MTRRNRKTVAIRKAFTLELQHKNFEGRDYADVTRTMKKWLGLSNDPKWENYWEKIAKAELRALKLMRKVKVNSKAVARFICYVVCKTI